MGAKGALVVPLNRHAERERDARQTSPLLPPKGTDPRTLPLFPCKSGVFGGPPEGAMIGVVDP
jgi:hypothetical protein